MAGQVFQCVKDGVQLIGFFALLAGLVTSFIIFYAIILVAWYDETWMFVLQFNRLNEGIPELVIATIIFLLMIYYGRKVLKGDRLEKVWRIMNE